MTLVLSWQPLHGEPLEFVRQFSGCHASTLFDVIFSRRRGQGFFLSLSQQRLKFAGSTLRHQISSQLTELLFGGTIPTKNTQFSGRPSGYRSTI